MRIEIKRAKTQTARTISLDFYLRPYVLYTSIIDGKLVNNRSREVDHDDAGTTTIYIRYINVSYLSTFSSSSVWIQQ